MLQRSPALNQYRARPKAKRVTISAPTGGWNTRAALNEMPPLDAVTLTNFFPTVGALKLRKGFESYATGVGAGDVETVLEYHSGSTRKFIAAGDGALYDISSAGAGVSLASGFTSNRWQGVMFNTKLHLVNGADDPKSFDGTTIATPAWVGSGLTNTSLIGVTVYRERLFFWQAASQDFWYGGVQAVTGTLTKFPMSMLGRLGGNIVAMSPWAGEAAQGSAAQEKLVIVMSSGEVVIYTGTDPGVAADWDLLGIWKIGAPLAVRGILKVAGDLLILTKDDWVSLARVIAKDRTGKDQTSKISGAAADAARDFSSTLGWAICHYPRGNMLLINVPISGGLHFDQHVLNTTTGAWCKFSGMHAHAWATYNDDLYFGGEGGVVYKADTGTDDNGASIEAEVQTAWTHFGVSQPKLMTMVRPVVSATGSLTLTLGLAFDFKEIQVDQSTSSVAEGPQWDVALWDQEQWSPESNIRTNWYDAQGEGTDVSLRLRYTGEGQSVQWFRSDYLFIPGVGL